MCTKTKELKSNFRTKLKVGWNVNTARNNRGVITVQGRSSGSKRLYRIIDFKRRFKTSAIVLQIVNDPRRSANIALIFTNEGLISFILATQNLKVGDQIYNMFSEPNYLTEGSSTFLKYIPIGSSVSSIELIPNYGAKYARSAGTFAKILKKTPNNKVFLKLKSNWNIIVSNDCTAVLGAVGDSKHWYKELKKAGNSRRIGFRPIVRGVAKNPVDHPHGGGEGKTSGGRPSVTPWGKITKGQPTVSKKIKKLKSYKIFR